LELAREAQAQIVILEWELPGVQTNAQLISSLRNENPQVKIISLSGRERVGQLAIALGATAFISKADSPDKLVECVKKCCGCEGEDCEG
jgi:DNA-binding NarL/FixJ family response regulator